MIATTTVRTKTMKTIVMSRTKHSSWLILVRQQLSSDLFPLQPSADNTRLDCDRLMPDDSSRAALPFPLSRSKNTVDEDVEVPEVAEVEVDAAEEAEEGEGEEEVTTTTVLIANPLWPSNLIGSRWRNSISLKSPKICPDPSAPIRKSRRKPWKTPFPRHRTCCGVVSWTNTTMFTIRSPPVSQCDSNAWQRRNFILSLPPTIPFWRSWPSMESVVPEMVTREVSLSLTIFWLI
mmetsp:Transcript_11434/g.28898  ORF Transcript_11434/g.28898 Transcript_11434/m.28898 type:complete len:234 (+) Transcript_11434:323-1024(+)